MSDIDKDFIHLARFTLEGKVNDSEALIRRTLYDIVKRRPDLSDLGKKILQRTNRATHERSLQSANTPIPVDMDSRLELVRREAGVFVDVEPIWPENIKNALEAVLAERNREEDLLKAGLSPTRSMLLVGPPGVGKTLSARWLAMKLERPLLVLDLAAVMSSYLGKTGNNIRAVLEFARRQPSVLLLDEFDAIAKRRDDAGEMGELKRLVTVLLQAIDDWPPNGLLLAATNHPELLDPAIWRRFDRVVEFPKPSFNEQQKYLLGIFGDQSSLSKEYTALLSAIFDGLTFAEIEKEVKALLRESIISQKPIEKCLESYLTLKMKHANVDRRLGLARALERQGYSQREIHDFTGCSRDTLRDHGIGIKPAKSSTSKRSNM